MSLRKTYYSLSPNMRLLARKLYYLPIDLFDGLTQKRPKNIPPKGDIYIGSGDFVKQGKHHINLLIRLINLEANNSVLDIGSGIGRTAIALTKHLSKQGKYEGFDVVEKGVKWCKDNITLNHPNFNFQYVPLQNDLYNTSEQLAKDFVFPYNDKSFDKAFLFSVFTHMQVEEIGQYLIEINRVLNSGGECLASFFIYNKTQEKSVENNDSFSFKVDKVDYKLMDKNVVSANIALSENLLDKLIANSGLIKETYIEGYWKKDILKSAEIDFQDLVVLRKP